MLTASSVRKRALVIATLALPAHCLLARTPVTAAMVAPPTVAARSCTTEHWVWSGSAALEPGTESFDTGVVVPVVAGTELLVVGASADGLSADGQARAMTVTVGGVPASSGGMVPGGAVVIIGDGAAADVRGATVVLDRCAVVRSAPPSRLPLTGVDSSWIPLLLGTVTVATGAAVVILARRRAAR